MPLKYVSDETVYRIEYDGAGMDGLVVRIKATSMERAIQLEGITFSADGTLNLSKEEILALYEDIAGRILEWNMTEPPSVESLLAQEPQWVIKFIAGWLKAMMYVGEVPNVNLELEAPEEEDFSELRMEPIGG